MPEKFYFDNNASAPLDINISQYIIEKLPLLVGNPSSIHYAGRALRSLCIQAKERAAAFLLCHPKELIFTSGGTEAVNLGIKSLIGKKTKGHIITSLAEHSAVIACCKELEEKGFEVTYLPTYEYGAVKLEAVQEAIRKETVLVCLMACNNETGVKTDIEGIASLLMGYQISFFVDAIASIGKQVFKGLVKGVSAMACSGHKFHALQGVGLLYLSSQVRCAALIVGGEQENGRRAGTENVLGIISIGKAFELMSLEIKERCESILNVRTKFEKLLFLLLPKCLINGSGPRSVNVSNIYFPGIDGESFLINLDKAGIAASHGSACSSGAMEPSRVLLSMGYPMSRVLSSIRFSFSYLNTEKEIEKAATTIADIVNQMTAF